MVKLQHDKGRNRFHATIPNQICKLKGWKQGTELVFLARDDGSIIMKEMPK